MGDSKAKDRAAAAAEAVDRARAMGAQLALFDPPKPPEGFDQDDAQDDAPRGPGRPKGARNKASSALRDVLIARGYRDPASVLAQMAGLGSTEHPDLVAIARARIITDAGDAEALAEEAKAMMEAAPTEKERKRAWALWADAVATQISLAHSLPGLVVQLLKEQRQAADSLMPYVFGKITPDAKVDVAQMVVQIAQPGSAPPPPGSARQRIGPPPMPQAKTSENQQLSDDGPEGSDE